MSTALLIVCFLGFGATWILIKLILSIKWGPGFGGRPADWHHTHTGAVPRLGGAALAVTFIAIEFYLSIFCPELRSSAPGREVVVFASLAMFLLGFWDDLRPVGPVLKLLGQIAIAVTVCFGGVGIEVCNLPFAMKTVHLGFLGPILTVIWLVSVTNLLNLIDGVDGLAAGISLMLMLLNATVSHLSGSLELLACGMAAALIGFLGFNFPPARIYLGDGGAYFLGFQTGLFSIVNSQKGNDFSALIASVFVLALPLADAVMTLGRRALRGLPLFRADRKHLHHRLLAIGYSRRKLVISAHGLTFIFLLMGLAAFWSKGEWVPILIGAAVLLLFISALACGLSPQWFEFHRLVLGSLRMRRRVKYALSLARWLESEGKQCYGPDELWPDLVCAAEKLGFTGLRLTLYNEHRIWQRRMSSKAGARRRLNHPCAGIGSLEFFGPACPLGSSPRGVECGRYPECTGHPGECMAEPHLIEIVSELLAEAWNKAASHWNRKKVRPRPGSTYNGGNVQSFRGCPMIIWAIGIGLLASAELRAAEQVATNDFLAVLRGVPAPELPATAAVLVQRVASQERNFVAISVVRAASRINPVATPAVVSEVIRVIPDAAAAVSGEGAREQPDDAPAIGRAAVGVAPGQALGIVRSICSVVPSNYYAIASAAAQAVPSASKDILLAVGAVRSDLRPYIESELARHGPRVQPVVARCLDRAEVERLRSAGAANSPGSISGGQSEKPMARRGPKPDRGGSQPPGGRNYARP